MPDLPRCFVDGKWPDGPLKGTATAEVRLLRQICRTLKRVCDIAGLSTHDVARVTGVSQSTVADLLKGVTWGTFHTIAALEIGLGVGLWPAERTLLKPAPCCYLAADGTWPAGGFVDGAPPEVWLAKKICERLESAREPRKRLTLSKMADKADLPLVVVQELVDGHRWPDLSTISRLERALPPATLWVRDSRRQ